MKILISNVSSPCLEDKVTSIEIENGIITQIGTTTNFNPEITIDASNLITLPGFIDLSAKLREPGANNKGSIYSESKSAAAAGFTSVCLPPDTNPVIDSLAVIELIEQRQAQANFSKILPLGAMTEGLKGSTLARMGTLINEGCVGISNAMQPLNSLDVLRKSMEYAATFDICLHLHAYEHSLVQMGTVHAGSIGTYLGLPGLSYSVETVALSQIIILAQETGAKIHICRVSSELALNTIKQAKNDGLDITVDVSLNQLFYTEQDLTDFDTNFHVLPPFRTTKDLKALRQGVINGDIDAICSDHQPHDIDAKLVPFADSEVGISSLDSFLPQILKFCEEESIQLNDIIDKITINPAKIIQTKSGKLIAGAPADIIILDPNKKWQLDHSTIISQGINTPLFNQNLQGQNQITIVDGKVIFKRI